MATKRRARIQRSRIRIPSNRARRQQASQVTDAQQRRAVAAMSMVLDHFESLVQDELADYIKQNFRLDASAAFILSKLRKRIDSFFSDDLAFKQFFSVAKSVERSVDESLKTVASIDVAVPTAAVDAYVVTNVSLIRTVASEHLADVERTINQARVEGLHVKGTQNLLQERFQVSKSRAKFWAVDQTLKLHSQITKERYGSAGLKTYIWTTSGDGAVRESHAGLDGRVFNWADPPATNPAGDRNNPGEDYRCRCTAAPNPAELEDET